MPNLDSFAREFWAAAFTSSLPAAAQGNPAPDQVALTAAQIADASLQQWAQRWTAPNAHALVPVDMFWTPVHWHLWVAGPEHALPSIGYSVSPPPPQKLE